jgi:DNA (cytosine-5)-methyltransferase 1
LLEDKVEEKYYISDKALNGILNSNFAQATLEARTEKDGVMGTILSRDYKDPKLVIEPKCEQVAQLEGGSYNEMTGRVYSSNGLSTTVLTFCGGGKEIKVLEDNSIKIFQYPRGANKGGVRDVEFCPTITTCSWENNCMLVEPIELNDADHLRVFDAYNGREIDNSKVGTICTNSGERQAGVFWVQNSDMRVRKLTPRECFRLMGVKDEDYERVARNQSKSSLYHLAGDSIIVNVLMAIFKELFM